MTTYTDFQHRFTPIVRCSQGASIEIFSGQPEWHVVGRISVFNGSVIHGFQVAFDGYRDYLIAFGGKQVCVTEIDIYEPYIGKKAHKSDFKDWILDVTTVTKDLDEDVFQIALALAHNVVVLFDWQRSEVLRTVHCEEKCILYSAHFVRENRSSTWDSLVLCAGTVFNQILTWKPSNKQRNDLVEVSQRLVGHDGVIFHISFNPKSQIFLSTSDDRSIRAWNCDHYICDGNKFETLNANNCITTMYGHEARVWKAESLQINGNDYVASVAEDGYFIVWKLTRENEKISSILLRKMNYRSNLLSLAVLGNESIAIGGGDGSIRVLSLDDILQTATCKEANTITKEEVGTIKTIKLLRNNKMPVIGHTDRGLLLHYDILGQKWRILDDDHDFSSYVVMSFNERENLLALGNTKGRVKVLLMSDRHELITSTVMTPFESKVLNVLWSEDNLFVSGPGGALLWYDVCAAIEEKGKILVSMRSSYILPQAKHRWITAILLVQPNSEVFICGDRRGSLHMFVKGCCNPRRSYFGVHGKLGVTSLKHVNGNVISTGKDGHWRAWRIVGDDFTLLSKHRAAQGMEWLEGCDAINYMGEKRMYVHGFHGNRFVVWSQYSGDEMFNVLCGGGHRSWDFCIKQSKFVFLKAGKLNIVEASRDIASEAVISCPFHSQHINCVRHLATFNHADRTCHIIATCSEDTKVVISCLVYWKSTFLSQFRVLRVIDDHFSSVRAISVVRTAVDQTDMKATLYTVGGRGSINAYEIHITTKFQENMMIKHVTSCNFAEKNESEVRFMDVSAWEEDDSHRIAVAGSDGKIRLFVIKNNSNEIKMSNTSKEYRRCFLTLSRMNDLIVCGATNGHIYMMTSTMDEVVSYKGHQSGVNAIASCTVKVKGENHNLLATGGDDNAIHVKLVRLKSTTEIVQYSCYDVTDAHAAQITGLYFHSFNHDGLLLSSVSIDQRLVTWRLLVRDDLRIEINQIGCLLTHVADVSSMDVSESDFFICGQGFSHYVSMGNDGFLLRR